MSQLYHEFGVTLSRRSAGEAWGIRLAGGADLNSPLIIIRVISATMSSASASLPFILRDHLFVVRQQVVNRHQRLWLTIKINSTQFVCWWYITIWCNFHRPQQEKAMRFCAAWKFAFFFFFLFFMKILLDNWKTRFAFMRGGKTMMKLCGWVVHKIISTFYIARWINFIKRTIISSVYVARSIACCWNLCASLTSHPLPLAKRSKNIGFISCCDEYSFRDSSWQPVAELAANVSPRDIQMSFLKRYH